MRGLRAMRYRLTSGVGVVLMFEQDGTFADTVHVQTRRLTRDDVEEIYMHVMDAERDGVDVDQEGEEVDERGYDEYEFGDWGD